MNDRAESGLAFDDCVRDTHLSAKSGQEDDEFDRVDVIGDEDEGGFLVLNESNDVVETVLYGVWLLADILLLLSFLDCGGFLV